MEVLLFTDEDVDDDELFVDDVDIGELNVLLVAILLLKPGGGTITLDKLFFNNILFNNKFS